MEPASNWSLNATPKTGAINEAALEVSPYLLIERLRIATGDTLAVYVVAVGVILYSPMLSHHATPESGHKDYQGHGNCIDKRAHYKNGHGFVTPGDQGYQKLQREFLLQNGDLTNHFHSR